MFIKDILKWIYFKLPNSKVYMFHHLSLNPKNDCSGCKLATEDFYDFIDSHGSYISVNDLVNKNSISRNGQNVITFDDGLVDVYEIAYPYLKARNIPFIIFILTDFLDTPGYMTTKQLLELSKDNLVTIGAHGTRHRILVDCTLKEKEEEIVKGKIVLEKIIGRKVQYFAYSHGQYNNEVIEIVKKAGYQNAFSVIGRPCNYFESKKKFILPRFNIDSTTIANYK